MDDDLSTARESSIGNGVHVADDDVRAQPHLQHRIRPAVHGDEDGPVVADIGAQGLQIRLVVVAAHDDEGLSAFKISAHIRHTDRVEDEVLFPLQVRHRVVGERGQLNSDPRPCLFHLLLVELWRLPFALGDKALAAHHRTRVFHDEQVAFTHVHDLRAKIINQRDACSEQDPRPHIRVTAGR